MVHEKARVPSKTRITDAGYDLYSIDDTQIQPGHTEIIRTGIQLSAPPGYYYTVEGRSSLWIKGVFPNRGIIDSTFCGDLVVSLVNCGKECFDVKSGDRIAQILIHKQHNAHFDIVDEFDEEYNQRGTNGFGSTGR